MAEFLSPEWIGELDTAARRATLPTEIGALVVEQVVRGGPRGEIRYHLRFADGGVRVHAGGAADPDVRFLTDYECAAAMHRGELNAQEALARGRAKLQGPLQGLRGHEAALREVNDVFAVVRSTTTYV
jgi:SCP-2 sterol transfer family